MAFITAPDPAYLATTPGLSASQVVVELMPDGPPVNSMSWVRLELESGGGAGVGDTVGYATA